MALHLRRPHAFLGPEFSRTTLLYLHYANAIKAIAIDYGPFYMCSFGHLVLELRSNVAIGPAIETLELLQLRTQIAADLTTVYDLFEDNKQTTLPILLAEK